MATTSHYHFHHNGVGARDTSLESIGNIIIYRGRKAACEKIIGINVAPYINAGIKMVKDAYRNKKRADARILERINIAIPRCLRKDEMQAVIQEYMGHLTKYQSQAWAAFHEMEGHNPHAHVVLVDRDIETDKRVYGVTERNSVKRMRIDWRIVCNNYLERNGYEERIDERSLKEQALDKEQEQGLAVQDQPQVDNSEVPFAERPSLDRVAFYRQNQQATEFINDSLNTLTEARGRLSEREVQVANAQEQALSTGEDLAKDYSRLDDTYKQFKEVYDVDQNKWKVGWAIPFLYTSNARKQAMNYRDAYAHAIEMKEQRKEIMDRDLQDKHLKEQKLTEDRQKVAEYEQALHIFGTEQEAQSALEMYQEDAIYAAQHITKDEAYDAYEAGELDAEQYGTLALTIEELERSRDNSLEYDDDDISGGHSY